MAGPYKKCPICGSNNDPGERCSCGGVAPKAHRKRKHKKASKTPAKKLEPMTYTVQKNGHTYMYITFKEIGITDA